VTQAEKFLAFVQQRKMPVEPDAEIIVRIENNRLVISRCWEIPQPTRDDGATSPTLFMEQVRPIKSVKSVR
jgi:hypothetical protein